MSLRDPMNRNPAKSRAARRRRLPRRPTLEGLEGRVLLSVAGGLDLTYGTNGYASTSHVAYGSIFGTFGSTASVVQPNGDLVVVGTSVFDGVGGSGGSDTFFALRYTANGALDTTFDINAEPILSSLSVVNSAAFVSLPVYSTATGVALESNGKIVVVGDVTDTAKVILLNADGSPDTSFGTGGIVTLGTVGKGDSSLDYASKVAILPGGQVAVAGSVEPTLGRNSPAVEVLNADGSVDTGYGTGGVAVVPLPSNAEAFAPIAPALGAISVGPTGPLSLVEQSNGALILDANAALPGLATSELVVTRLTATGTLDTSFGTGGQATIAAKSAFPSATLVSAGALAIESDGELIVGGAILLPGGSFRGLAVELTAAGAVDTTFGIGGYNILTPPFPGIEQDVNAIAIQADGKIVLADGFAPDFTRLDADGLPDVTFGAGGTSLINPSPTTIQSTPVASGSPGTVGLAITSSGNILASENDYLAGARLLLGQGASNDFLGDGESDPAIYITSNAVFAYATPTDGVGGLAHFGPNGVGQSLPAPGDYGGDGVDELGLYLPSLGAFAIDPLHGGSPILVPFGIPGAGNSLPAPGDYDKSGVTELGVYLPTVGIYAYRPVNANGQDVYVAIGLKGAGNSIPVPGDYFGTGQDDVAVYEPSTGDFLILNPVNNQILTVPLGTPGSGDIPVPGDYSGSGHAEPAVYDPATGNYSYLPSLTNSQAVTVNYAGAPPTPGDYDGSGHDEPAFFSSDTNSSTGFFGYLPASGTEVAFSFGPGFDVAFPYTLASATDLPAGFGQGSTPTTPSASVEIPLTPDVLDTLDGPAAHKKAGTV